MDAGWDGEIDVFVFGDGLHCLIANGDHCLVMIADPVHDSSGVFRSVECTIGGVRAVFDFFVSPDLGGEEVTLALYCIGWAVLFEVGVLVRCPLLVACIHLLPKLMLGRGSGVFDPVINPFPCPWWKGTAAEENGVLFCGRHCDGL